MYNKIMAKKDDPGTVYFFAASVVLLILLQIVTYFIFSSWIIRFLPLVLGFLYFSWKKFDLLVYSLIFIAPLYYAPVYFFPILYFLDSGYSFLSYGKDILWIYIVVLYLFKSFISNKKISITAYDSQVFLLCGYIIANVITFTFFEDGAISAILGIRGWLEYFPAFFIFREYWKNEKKRKIIQKIIFSSVSIVVVLAFIEISGVTPFGKIHGGLLLGHRVVSTLRNPGNFGVVVGFFAILNLGIWSENRSRYINLVFSIILLGLVFLSKSMSSILLIIFGCVHILLLRKKMVNVFFIIIMFGLIFAQQSDILKRFSWLASGSDPSSQLRIQKWEKDFSEITIKKFLIGKGITSASGVLSGNTTDISAGDNQYMMMFFQGGIIGLLFFILLFIITFIRVRNLSKIEGLNKKLKGILIGIDAYLLGFMIANIGGDLFTTYFPINFLIWCVLGIVHLTNTDIKKINFEWEK